MGSVVKKIGSATSKISPKISGALAAHIVTFSFMKLLGVTGSLYVRGCGQDGEGINFNTALQTHDVNSS